MNKFLKLKDDEKINVSTADVEQAATEGVSFIIKRNYCKR